MPLPHGSFAPAAVELPGQQGGVQTPAQNSPATHSASEPQAVPTDLVPLEGWHCVVSVVPSVTAWQVLPAGQFCWRRLHSPSAMLVTGCAASSQTMGVPPPLELEDVVLDEELDELLLVLEELCELEDPLELEEPPSPVLLLALELDPDSPPPAPPEPSPVVPAEQAARAAVETMTSARVEVLRKAMERQ